jgi:hypothetical protein
MCVLSFYTLGNACLSVHCRNTNNTPYVGHAAILSFMKAISSRCWYSLPCSDFTVHLYGMSVPAILSLYPRTMYLLTPFGVITDASSPLSSLSSSSLSWCLLAPLLSLAFSDAFSAFRQAICCCSCFMNNSCNNFLQLCHCSRSFLFFPSNS